MAPKGMKNGKALGHKYGITEDVWKGLGEEGADMLLDMLQKSSKQENMPKEWRGRVIVPIFKEKGDVHDYANYRCIQKGSVRNGEEQWKSED